MVVQPNPGSSFPGRWPFALLGITCILVVAIGALPYAGGWNDGSRLAAVQSIVDLHTLAIDESIFVNVPTDTVARGVAPYRDEGGLAHGTFDKLYIDGHYYSDKPALISLLMAVVYQTWLWIGGPTAAARPDLFCLVVTWGTAGMAYLVSLVCLYLIGRRLQLQPRYCLLLCTSLAFATIAPVYTRHVNNHVMLLAVSSALVLNLVAYSQELAAERARSWRLLVIGLLAGVGYVLDLGLGPLLLLSLAITICWRSRALMPLAMFLTGALPALAAHHALNYSIGGTIKPMNMVPEYSAWEGCPFNPSNMTGLSRKPPAQMAIYAASLLHGKHGFLAYNLPLLLALVAAVVAWRALPASRPEIGFALCWCIGGWLMYGCLSNNYGGVCCSIRWFLPFLAPAFYLIALLIRERPTYAWDLAVLSTWGSLLTSLLWMRGPWNNKMLLLYWPIQGFALISWCVVRRWRQRIEQTPNMAVKTNLTPAA